MKNIEALIKYLGKSHRAWCKMHNFNLQEKRHCTCGRDKSQEDLNNILQLIAVAGDVNSWLKRTDREGTAHQRSLQEVLDKVQ